MLHENYETSLFLKVSKGTTHSLEARCDHKRCKYECLMKNSIVMSPDIVKLPFAFIGA